MNIFSLSFVGLKGLARKITLDLVVENLEKLGYKYSPYKGDFKRHFLLEDYQNGYSSQILLIGDQPKLMLDSANFNFKYKGLVYSALTELNEFLEAARQYVEEFNKLKVIEKNITITIKTAISKDRITPLNDIRYIFDKEAGRIQQQYFGN